MKHSLKSTQEQPTCQIKWPRTVLAALVAALVTLIVLIRGKYIRYNQREMNKRTLRQPTDAEIRLGRIVHKPSSPIKDANPSLPDRNFVLKCKSVN